MKFTLSWLKTHLATDAPLSALTETLTRIGLELEGVDDRGAALRPFLVAHVMEAARHPNADRLRVCRVDTGQGVVSVVCGAPNARTGMKAVFAPPGSFIPGTQTTLRVGEIRGVQSAGMLLSAREIGLGEDHAGIIELPDDAPTGMAYVSWARLDDPVIEINVTPNRGDCFAVRGIARDLAATGIGTLQSWQPARVAPRFQGGPRWQIDWPEACPWILGRTIRAVKNGPSPRWLQEWLTAIGLRPINALVDITNFFTIDLGRPLHVFDVAKLSGNVLVLRPGRGETFRALNGKDYTVGPEDCAIADAACVQSMAGVIGGEASGCEASTTEVFIECALFDPVRIALTGRRHQIVSDARQRFERGIDPGVMPDAVEAATAMILDLCGGEPGEVVVAGSCPQWQRDATLRFNRLATFGGSDIEPDAAVETLERLGFALRHRNTKSVTVSVPSWRNDIAAPVVLDQAPGLDPAIAAKSAQGCAEIEPECDLIEEVLRLKGLDAVAAVSLPRVAPVPVPTLTPRQQRTELVRRALASQGLAECVTFSFMASAEAALFGETAEALRLTNPIAADLDQLRPSPIGTLALAVRRNATRGWPDVGLFEVGPGFRVAAPDGQRLFAAALRAGSMPRHWSAPVRLVDVFDAKADLWAVLAMLSVPPEAVMISAEDVPQFYHPGQAGVVRYGPKAVLGSFGALHPRVLAALDISVPVVGFVLDVDAVPEQKRRRAGPELSLLQPVRRDFAFVVERAVPADAVLRAARGADRPLISGVSLFDAYEGDQVPKGRKSLAIEVVFQPREQTLTDAEIEAACQKVIAAVVKATGATLR